MENVLMPTVTGEFINLARYRCETNKIIFVPVFQRNYKWDLRCCRDLLNDVIRASKTGESHLLGDMSCSQYDEDRIQINDGQQRFVTILLLALAIRDVMEEMAEKDKANAPAYLNIAKYAEGYIYAYPLNENGNAVTKVTVNYDDLLVMERIVRHKDGSDYMEGIPCGLKKECRIEPNYKFFLTEIRKYVKNGGNAASLLKAIDRMGVSMVYCSLEKAQQIYADKNTKGMVLMSTENIKNFLLACFPSEEQNEIYMKYWLEMERCVLRSNIDNFVTDVMIILNELFGVRTMKWTTGNVYANTANLFRLMKGKSREKAEAIFKGYLEFAKIYEKYLRFPNVFSTKNADKLTLRLYEFESVFNGNKGNCLVLYLLSLYENGKMTKADMTECMRALVTAQCRGKFVGQFKGQQRHTASKYFKQVYMETKNLHKCVNVNDYVWKLFVNMKGTQGIPSDRTAIAYFTENQLGGGFGKLASSQKLATRYLFYCMNAVAEKNVSLPDFNGVDFCVEHILPPKNKAVWKKELGIDNPMTMERVVEQMGNLALVVRNSDDDSFIKKRTAYAKSPFPLTREIGERTSFTPKDVRQQTAKLAKLFVKAFPIPKKYKQI